MRDLKAYGGVFGALNWLILLKIAGLYVLLVMTILWHELGHGSKHIRVVKYFPFPSAAAYDARFRYGGLLLNFSAAFLIFWVHPQNVLLLAFGLLNFLHVTSYLLLGSVMPEPKKIFVHTVQDDVPNSLNWLFIPAGISIIYYLGSFYWSAAQNVFAWVVV